MISDAVWNLGGPTSYENIKTSQFYTAERSTTTYGNHAATWAGKIGLIYPSDYGYATAGGSDSNRTLCLAQRLDLWDKRNYSPDCKNNDWLLYNKNGQWTITPWSGTSGGVFIIGDYGNVNGNVNAKQESNDYVIVRPSLYLKSSIEITGGYGTKNKPYTLGYNEYKITYDLDGGTVSTNNPTSYTSQSNDINLNNPTKEGYKFVGWTGTGLDKATETVTISSGSTGNREYKANWVKAYKVTFNGNGGSSTTKVYKENESLGTLPSTSKSGYTFNGWYTELSGGSKITSDTKVTGDTTYYAQWTATTYTKNVSGSNGWSADYTCSNGRGTMTACYYNGTKCDGGSSGYSYRFDGCTYSASDDRPWPYYNCSTSMSRNYVHGGGMSSSISC